MPTFRIYEVQNEIVARKWMYDVDAPNEVAAMKLIRDGEVDPIDCGTMGEPFYAESGFAVQSHDADSDVSWEKAVQQLESSKGSGEPLRAIVTIQGGNYQGAIASGPIELSVLDYDNWEACDEGHEDEAKHYAELEAEVERLKTDPTNILL